MARGMVKTVPDSACIRSRAYGITLCILHVSFCQPRDVCGYISIDPLANDRSKSVKGIFQPFLTNFRLIKKWLKFYSYFCKKKFRFSSRSCAAENSFPLKIFISTSNSPMTVLNCNVRSTGMIPSRVRNQKLWRFSIQSQNFKAVIK